MATREGWFDPDTEHEVDTLADLAAYAGVTLTRDGDWLSVTTDLQGDPKWSDQAEEFYLSIAGFVREGEVHLRGEDGSTWSYAYSPSGLQQHGGTSGGGAAPAPAAAADAPAPEPPPAPPAPPADEPPPVAQSQEPPPPPADQPGGFSYPGKEQRPAAPQQPPPTPPPTQDAGWAGVEADPPPAAPGRLLLMSVVLVVGVLLIIGLALLVAGF